MTEGEVSIPLDAIEKLVVKRAVKANVEPGNPNEICSNKFNLTGEQVYLPLEDGWDVAGNFIFGNRKYISENGTSWDVGGDRKIIGLTPYSVYGRDVSIGYGKALNSGFKEISKSYLSKNGISDIHAFKAEWLGTNKNLKLFDVVKSTETHELLIIRKTTQEIIINTKIIIQ